MFDRYATTEEIRNAEFVDAKISDEELPEVCEMVGNYYCAWGAERKKEYSKVYRYAKKIGVTVPQLVDWYFVD